MASRENKSSFLGTRISEKSRNAFIKKAKRYGVPSDVLRELIDAFTENRLEIHAPSVIGKWKENLYHVPRIKD